MAFTGSVGRLSIPLACAGTDVFTDRGPMVEWPDWHKSDVAEAGIKLRLSQYHLSLLGLGDDLLWIILLL